MTTGLYRVYWRGIKGHAALKGSPPSTFKYEFIAGFVDPEDAVLWIRTELNHLSADPWFEYKIMHMGKRYIYKPGD